MIRKTLLLFLTCYASLSFAQSPYVSKLGKFQVVEKKGCAPFTVTFQTLVAGGCVPGVNPCAIDFLGDGFNTSSPDHASVSPATFTYTTPGTYLLKVCYSNQCSPSEIDEIEIQVVANIAPDFDLYTCSGNAVQVKINDANYNQYVIAYSDGATTTVPSGSLAKDNHTFATAGAKTITVRGRNLNAADNCATANKSFSATASLPIPSFTSLTSISTTQIELTYTLPANVLGRVDIATNNNTTFQQLKNVYDDARDTIPSVSNETNFYCFRIGSVDACTNAVTYSSPICSMVFTAAAQDGFNRLNWTSNASGVLNYDLKRDTQANYFGGISAALTTINDNEAGCNIEHCYQLTANYAGAIATSLEKCVTSFTTLKPPTITDITISLDDNNDAVMTWADATEAIEYSIFKNTNGGAYALVNKLPEPPYTDTDFDLGAPSCYEILYNDACNNVSNVSLEACPVVLSGTVSSENIVSLSWTAYQGWQNGMASYRLEKYSKTGALLRTYSLGNATTFTDDETDLFNQVAYYKIFILANDAGLGPATSNMLEVIKRPNLFYATAFTPDGQGPAENETFRVFGQFVASFEMKVFNRWGELIFTANDIDQGWDGKFKGVDQPDGTYAFVANLTDFAGRTSTRSGSVVLMRKK